MLLQRILTSVEPSFDNPFICMTYAAFSYPSILSEMYALSLNLKLLPPSYPMSDCYSVITSPIIG